MTAAWVVLAIAAIVWLSSGILIAMSANSATRKIVDTLLKRIDRLERREERRERERIDAAVEANR